MEKLLLHHCCAPCTPNVLEFLGKEYQVLSFWFNPNIQPADEHDKRKESLKSYLKSLGRELIANPDFTKDDRISKVRNEGSERCRLCYHLRLSKTAEHAKKNNIKFYSSTLLSSPHQKHEEVKVIAEQIAKAEGLNFLYKDFRPFYYEGKNRIKEMGLYSQKYCGCMPSLDERMKEQKK